MTTIIVANTKDLGHCVFTDGLATRHDDTIYSDKFNKIRKGRNKNEVFLAAGNVDAIDRAHQLYLQNKSFHSILPSDGNNATIVVIAKSCCSRLCLNLYTKKRQWDINLNKVGQYITFGSGNNYMHEYLEYIVKDNITSSEISNAFNYVDRYDRYTNNIVSIYNFPTYDDIR